VRELLYSTEVKALGFPPSGSTSYYSANASKADAERAQAYLDAKQISGYNTRVFKQEEDGETTYVVRLSAAEAKSEEEVPAEEYEGVDIKVVPGDFAPFMARVVSELEKAQAHVANVDQEKMLKEYVRSFSTGSVDAHVEASKHWVKDKGPSVESYIGHIESYRDPFGEHIA
jgi:dipeptidyl-peptidase-3